MLNDQTRSNREEKITFPIPKNVRTPWFDHLGDLPATLEYDSGTLYEKVQAVAKAYPNNIAFDFMGKSTNYRHMLQQIDACARSLRTIGTREGDRITIAMPIAHSGISGIA